MEGKKVYLTSAEIASLWTAYMNDSMSKCILGHMLKHIEDEDIKPAIRYAYDISSQHLKQLVEIFNEENYAIPNGFTSQDVNEEAPWLYTDIFCLDYVNFMARVGMITYSGTISMSSRGDIRHYFTTALTETSSLYNMTTDIALSKGVFNRHPYIQVPKESSYINSKKYLSGLNPFSSKRPLNAVEISHLFMNIVTNVIGVQLCLSFGQTSSSKEIQQYMQRGKEISNKHIKVFADTLFDDDIPTPRLPDMGVSNSTTPTFSDKLLMFQMSLLSAAGTGNYATGAAASQRSDLALNYERLSLEIGQFAKKGADIMIKHNWLEQPPGIEDRDMLVSKKERQE